MPCGQDTVPVLEEHAVEYETIWGGEPQGTEEQDGKEMSPGHPGPQRGHQPRPPWDLGSAKSDSRNVKATKVSLKTL